MDGITALCLGLTVCLWSSTASLVVATQGLPPTLVVTATFLIGGLLLGLRRRSWQGPWREFALGAVCFAAYRLMTFAAFALAPPLPVNLLMSLSPLLIVLLPPVIIGPPYRWRLAHVLGACGGAGGAVLALHAHAPTAPHAGTAAAAVLGLVIAAASAVLWAVYALLVARRGRGSSAAVGSYLLGAAAICAGISLVDGSWRGPIPWSPRALLTLLALGIGPTGIAYACWDQCLRRGDPRVVGAVLYLTPVTSTLLLALTAHAPLTAAVAGSAVLVTIGAVTCVCTAPRPGPTGAAPVAATPQDACSTPSRSGRAPAATVSGRQRPVAAPAAAAATRSA